MIAENQVQEELPPQALEACTPKSDQNEPPENNVFKQLAFLDQFLSLWIFLAMAVGIILGNSVPNSGRVLQRGKFVGVSIPIGV